MRRGINAIKGATKARKGGAGAAYQGAKEGMAKPIKGGSKKMQKALDKGVTRSKKSSNAKSKFLKTEKAVIAGGRQKLSKGKGAVKAIGKRGKSPIGKRGK